jgi:hypothetical protein
MKLQDGVSVTAENLASLTESFKHIKQHQRKIAIQLARNSRPIYTENPTISPFRRHLNPIHVATCISQIYFNISHLPTTTSQIISLHHALHSTQQLTIRHISNHWQYFLVFSNVDLTFLSTPYNCRTRRSTDSLSTLFIPASNSPPPHPIHHLIVPQSTNATSTLHIIQGDKKNMRTWWLQYKKTRKTYFQQFQSVTMTM